jgi:hypothetical protein
MHNDGIILSWKYKWHYNCKIIDNKNDKINVKISLIKYSENIIPLVPFSKILNFRIGDICKMQV